MEYSFLILDSLTQLKKDYKEIIEIFAEYNLFRIESFLQFKPDLAQEIYGENIEDLLQIFRHSIQSKEAYNGFFEYVESRLQDYFKYFCIHQGNIPIAQAMIQKYTETIVILHWVYVRPEFRGNHFGDILLDKIIKTAKKDGFSKMYLETIPTLTTALKLYEKFGFVYRDYYPTTYLTPERAEKMEAIFMEYDIKP